MFSGYIVISAVFEEHEEIYTCVHCVTLTARLLLLMQGQLPPKKMELQLIKSYLMECMAC